MDALYTGMNKLAVQRYSISLASRSKHPVLNADVDIAQVERRKSASSKKENVEWENSSQKTRDDLGVGVKRVACVAVINHSGTRLFHPPPPTPPKSSPDLKYHSLTVSRSSR